jgi:hypothetical protein
MAFECLLVSSDSKLVSILGRVLEELSICMIICPTPSRASAHLRQASTELIVINREDAPAPSDFLQEIWWASRARKPTIVAVSSLNRVSGAHLLLRRPVTSETGATSLKAAYFRMLLDHRQHTRYALMDSITVAHENRRAIPVIRTDIGDGGVGFTTEGKLTIGHVLSFHLLLPVRIEISTFKLVSYGPGTMDRHDLTHPERIK